MKIVIEGSAKEISELERLIKNGKMPKRLDEELFSIAAAKAINNLSIEPPTVSII